jgi:RNA polymerase sigma factor (sigma-70 family)
LLRLWITARDQTAFETLVLRHGPAVLALCRRLVRREQDAEDAFQATFLALARQAGSLRNGEAVAGWLHRVAWRVALRIRAEVIPGGPLPADGIPCSSDSTPDPADDAARRELHAVLLEEVARLPGRFRAVVVLCHLEGLTNEETARELNLPVGTVNSRLARARRWLHSRLIRRGVVLPAGGIAALAFTPALVSATLVRSTVRAALLFAAGKAAVGLSPVVVTLTRGAIKAMWLSNLKCVAAVLLAMGLLAGVGLFSYRLLAESPKVPSSGRVFVPPAEAPRGPLNLPSSGDLGPSTSSAGSTEERRAVQRQSAMEEVELLETQVKIKQAQVAAARVVLEAAGRRMSRLDALRAAARVSDEDFQRARDEVESARAQVQIREAELTEPAVRLNYAKRRLSALEPPVPIRKAMTEERLRELERQMEALRKEVEELRRAVRPDKGK